MRKPPFQRVLVANRGEIAVRVIRACRELGSESVAVYSDADVDALHVREADQAIRIGPASPADSYLRGDAIVAAAVAAHAQAVHPGYGFLSERAGFAEACASAGLTFVGPAPHTLASLGDKLAARRSAAAAGVPILPGTLDPAPVDRPELLDRLELEADRVGWPLLVKAAAGGGGRGMRLVESRSELRAALVAASNEARAAFGDGSVYLERFVVGARHVEVQLIGDSAGDVVALGERDCSVQRRHQKLVEEAPAPGLTREARRELHRSGVAVASAVGLQNAATAEFLLTPDGDFAFLEVNARLQVEHGVTELVADVDLVQEQLRIAAGEPLSGEIRAAAEHAADPSRHAIEVRIGAEDPARGFAPVSGAIARWREPAGPGVRVDSGVESGMEIGTEYDPLLAKLLVVAGSRDAALARLRRALSEFQVGGIQTTLAFHRWLAAEPAFQEARLGTDFVERRWDPAPSREAARGRAVRALVAWIAQRDDGRVRPALRAEDGPPLLRDDGMRPPAGGDDVGGTSGASVSGRWLEVARREGVERWPV